MNPTHPLDALKEEAKKADAVHPGLIGSGDVERFLDRAFALGRYEGANGCAEAVDIKAAEIKTSAMSMRDGLQNAASSYAESLNPKKRV